MKNKLSPLILSSVLLAGPLSAEIHIEEPAEASISDYFKLSLDTRLRYESRIQQGFDHSDALTLRARPGVHILPNSIVSAFVESEHTTVIADDFRASNSTLNPFRANNTQIIDAESNELNQAYLQLKHQNFTARIGRQRIQLDNLHFVGNAGWRQNEQTFEAVSLNYEDSKYFFHYSFANQLNRVFGSEARGNQRKFEGDMHLINASVKVGESKIGGYAYLLEFDAPATFANSNTYGAQIDYRGFHAEYAYQTESGDKEAYGADYAHVYYASKTHNLNYKFGVEYLQEDFVSPTAALHGPNGYADVFIAARRGIPGNELDGLADIYGSVSTQINSIKLQGDVHYFFDDSFADSYGWEVDFVISKKISDNLTVLGKSAYFVGDERNIFNQDVIQNSVQLDYKF